MPYEVRLQVLGFLTPREIAKCSSVSKSWHSMCFDGQLWRSLDVSEYYRVIPADALVNIIASAGPFVRDLNLRGCLQLRERWLADNLPEACQNLENFSLEGCIIDRSSMHCFLLQNSRLVHINLSGLQNATNAAMKIIAQNCPKLEHLNVTWCSNIETRGLRKVIEACPNLKDLRAGEVRGWDDVDFAHELFKRNTLERLILTNCDSLTDESLSAMTIGIDGELDYLTGRVICPPRKLKHLDLTRCRGVTDVGIKTLAHNVPYLEGLQLSKCNGLTDDSLTEVLPTLPVLTHLDLEELDQLSNATLLSLSRSQAVDNLKHLSISYCENLGDAGMLPILKASKKIESLDMDNTRVSDLVLVEAASMIRERNRTSSKTICEGLVPIGLRMVVFDCANVTWTGVREVLSRNAEIMTTYQASYSASSSRILDFSAALFESPPSSPTLTAPLSLAGPKQLGQVLPPYEHSIISLKAFYTWQPTINEHTKRVQRGDFAAARRLERKWAEWMMAGEEVANGGRRRRRRMREAMEAIAGEDLEGPGTGPGGGARRRRARSGPVVGSGASCVIM
jgi:F-box/leucine-rich repeat protein 2/20